MGLRFWWDLRKVGRRIKDHLHQGVGLHQKYFLASDPEGEDLFLTWLEGRRRMAHHVISKNVVFLRLVSVPVGIEKRAPPGATEFEGELPTQGIEFPWEEADDLQETFRGMYRKAREVPETEKIIAWLVDSGDLMQRTAWDMEKEWEEKHR